jgi:hypothetical protein
MLDFMQLPFFSQDRAATDGDGFFTTVMRCYRHTRAVRAAATAPVHSVAAAPRKPASRQFGLISAVGFDDAHAWRISEMLEFMSLGPLGSCLPVKRLVDLAASKERLAYLFVNVDAFADVEDAVTALLAFRRARPEVIVIINSSSLLLDGLGTERQAICEVSLRAPVTFSRFKQGMRAAIDNKREHHIFA